jgi:hypothetical protein
MSALFVNSTVIGQKASNEDPFLCYLWKNRLLLLSEADGETFEEIVRVLEASKGIAARDLVWMVFHNGQIASNADLASPDSLYRWAVHTLFKTGKNILLIGKDGGIKARFDHLSLDEVYQVIDGMPMRRREMRERNELDG